MSLCASGGDQTALDPLELKVVVSHPMWVLGTEFRAYARAVYAFNHWATSPVPEEDLKITNQIAIKYEMKTIDRHENWWQECLFLGTILSNCKRAMYILPDSETWCDGNPGLCAFMPWLNLTGWG